MKIEDIIVSMSGLNPKVLKHLSEEISSSEDLWQMDKPVLQEMGISNKVLEKLFSQSLHEKAVSECEFLYKNNVRAISVFDKDYPKQLLDCIDAPFLMYVKGDLDLNLYSNKFLSFIGTRNSSPYGEGFCASLVEELSRKQPQSTVVSGLAYGIDVVAHTSALKNGLKTIAVLANGLETVQPTAHFSVAQDILSQGGAIISEYSSYSPIFKHYFAARNRIVAGLSKATIVIETPMKGGSMITASYAFDYNRDVFSIPHRLSDVNGEGCNNLIKSSKAQLITGVEDIEYYLGWDKQPTLFDDYVPELFGNEKLVYECFDSKGELTSDEIVQRLGISAGDFFQAATMLQLSGLIKSVRGNLYIKA